MTRMPTAFVSHGAPTVVFQADRRQEWAGWGAALGRPAAVLVVSAHWETAGIKLGTAESRELIYDFYGFPEELYSVRYPAPGAPALRDRVTNLLTAAWGQAVGIENDRGWDHGVWTPLYSMFPEADVPVLQLSLPRNLMPTELLALGRDLAPLRDEDILILGSGSLTHNLRALQFSSPDAPPPDWAREFDDWCADRIKAGDFEALGRAAEIGPAYRENHPTPEHYLPLLVAAGAAENESEIGFPLSGFEFGALSKRCVQFGVGRAETIL